MTWGRILEVDGYGAGGPALADDSLVAVSSGALGEDGAALILLALDESTGATDWRLALDGFDDDWIHGVAPSTNGWQLVGASWSTSRYQDAWLVAVDASGNATSSTVLGGPGNDSIASIAATATGFALAGATDSYGTGGDDVWVVRTDSSGDPVWQRAYGGTGDEEAVVVLADATGLLIAGSTTSFGEGDRDLWLLRLDLEGNIVWQKSVGGANDDEARGMAADGDGWLVVGETRSTGLGLRDAWWLQLDSQGNVLSQSTLGGPGNEAVTDVASRPGGGWLFCGHTYSAGSGQNDAWLVALDAGGAVVWQKIYGGDDNDSAKAVSFAADGGIFISAVTRSFGRDRSAPWILRSDSDGAVAGCPAGMIAGTGFPTQSATLTVATSTATMTSTNATSMSSSATAGSHSETNHQQCP